jgi:hypothetical protein
VRRIYSDKEKMRGNTDTSSNAMFQVLAAVLLKTHVFGNFFHAVVTRIYYRHFGGSITFIVRVKQCKMNISDVSKAQQFFDTSVTIY